MFFSLLKLCFLPSFFLLILSCGEKKSYDYKDRDDVFLKTKEETAFDPVDKGSSTSSDSHQNSDFYSSQQPHVPSKLILKSLKRKERVEKKEQKDLVLFRKESSFDESELKSDLTFSSPVLKDAKKTALLEESIEDKTIFGESEKTHKNADEKQSASSSDLVGVDNKAQTIKPEDSLQTNPTSKFKSWSPSYLISSFWGWVKSRFIGASASNKPSSKKKKKSSLKVKRDELRKDAKERLLSDQSLAKQKEHDDNLKRLIVKNMVILGDSLSAGYAIDTTKGFRPSPTSPAYSSGLAMTKNPESFREVFEQALKSYKKKDESAYGGSLDGLSHAEKLHLEASSVINLSSFKKTILEQLEHLPEKISYAVIQVSFMDLCTVDDFNDQAFLKDYQNVLNDLKEHMPENGLVLIVPPLDIASIYRHHKKSDAAFSLFPGLRPLSCEMIRDGKRLGPQARMCPLLSDDTVRDPLKSQAQAAFIDRYQRMMDIFEQLQALYPHVRVADTVRHLHLSGEAIAVDCLHPNKEGHKLLAKSTWHHIESLVKIPHRRSFK